MLTRLLALSVIYLILSMLITFLRGTHRFRASTWNSIVWLAWTILCGDVWGITIFGYSPEVAGFSLLAFLLGTYWIRRLPDWNGLGQTAWTMSFLSTSMYVIYSLVITAFSPLRPFSYLVSFILFFVELAAFGLSLTFLFEILDSCTRVRWNHLYQSATPIPGYLPKVSLHVPAYNEPEDIVESTLRHLAKLDYPNFEVILVDNNTPDEATWRPLEKVCRELGPNFKVLHLEKWPGYKSGALNFALSQTSPDSEIVGVIDADYQVLPKYLKESIPYFHQTDVAFLQTPQDYREYHGNPFLEASYDSYKYFFEVSMPSRNEHNAIIFGGTMGLIRRSVLREIGGWDEWCITEDAEASLRILKRGYRSVYINQSYGFGLMPTDYASLKKQRFRWCFGGIQILRKHWETLMPWAKWVDPTNQLTPAQKYFYLVGSLQWFNELVVLIFASLLMLGGVSILAGWGLSVRPLLGAISTVPLILLGLGLSRFLWALRTRLKIGWRRAMRAMGSFFSLSWAVTLGSIQGSYQSHGIFLRTPKKRTQSGVFQTMQNSIWETTLGVSCGLIGLAMAVFHHSFFNLTLLVLLFWQAGFFLTSPVYGWMSYRTGIVPVQAASRGDIEGRFVTENKAARWAFAIFLLFVTIGGTLLLLPKPTSTPKFVNLLPPELQPQQILGVPPIPTPTPGLSIFPTHIPTHEFPHPTQTPLPKFTTTPTPFISPTANSTLKALPTRAPTKQATPTRAPTQFPSQVPTRRSTP